MMEQRYITIKKELLHNKKLYNNEPERGTTFVIPLQDMKKDSKSQNKHPFLVVQ